MKDETLLPCPFCGGKAEFDYDDDGLNWISCSKCGISTDTAYHTDVDARETLRDVWNRRALQSGNSAQPVTVPDGWIPVSERMPEFNDEVLAWHRHGYSLIAVYSTSKDPITYKTYRCLVDNKGHEIDATHWQPLPDAPKVTP